MLDIEDNTIEDQSESYLDPDECYLRLGIAIIKQATNDYRKALVDKNKKMILDCERFFNSQWCNFILVGGSLDGKTVMNRIKRDAKVM